MCTKIVYIKRENHMTHHILAVTNLLQNSISEVMYSVTKAINDMIIYHHQQAVIRQTIKELSSMSDKDLDDIGVNRYDIPFIARGEFHR
jgi:uncharacterized protein YjiS (DUF1127 family)